MTNRVYKSAQGKSVDLGALILKNENERAVGNMKVNARGDLIDADNQPIVTREAQSKKSYSVNTTSAPVMSSNKEAMIAAERAEQERLDMEARAARSARRAAIEQGSVPAPDPEKPLTGLAAAMAAAAAQPDEE